MTNLNRKLMITRKPRWDTVVVLLFFAAFFLYGCLVFQDYGISVDEMTQRGHSLINYKYLCLLYQISKPLRWISLQWGIWKTASPFMGWRSSCLWFWQSI